jgi:predicted RNA binding protein YcfA (HicA-like mRNA interferase family)
VKTPRSLSGRDLANHLIRRWEYRESHQTGSHIVLRTETPSGQTLPIPAHKPLRTGTLAAILRMAGDHKRASRDQIPPRPVTIFPDGHALSYLSHAPPRPSRT